MPKMCHAVLRKAMDNPDFDVKPDESCLERVLRHIKHLLLNLNSHCVICFKPLSKAYNKLRDCGEEVCAFRFEENQFGNIFNEVNCDPEIAIFQVFMAFSAFASPRAIDLTEPFPSFLLDRREIRTKLGNLDNIAEAQKEGLDVKSAKTVDKTNKRIKLGCELLIVIYSVLQDIDQIENEEQFK